MNKVRLHARAIQPSELALDCVVERRVANRGWTKFAGFATQLLLDLFEDRARSFGRAVESDLCGREQLRLIIVQVASDPGALLINRGKHSERKLAHEEAAPRRIALQHPARREWSEALDDRLRPCRGCARVAGGERDRPGPERNTNVRSGEHPVL